MTEPRRTAYLWRTLGIAASVAGMVAVPVFRRLLDDGRIGIYIACAVPFAVGLVAMTRPMENRTRILFLWLASLLASFVAMITFMSGLGIVVAVIVLAYLVVAWGLNETGAEPGHYDHGR